MWKDLTMQQKSEVMGMAVREGISDLDQIKKLYDDSIPTGVYASPNNTYDSVPEYPSPKDVRYDNGGKVWKALKNIKYRAIADPSFNRFKTGAGDIEYFSAEEPEGIIYNNGYYHPHPSPGEDIILYNPATNDEQDIKLDALHIMPKDSTYDTLNTLYRQEALGGDAYVNAWKNYNDDLDWKLKNHKMALPMDSFDQYLNNESDGLLRNMFIEGTPEYIESKRYYPYKEDLKRWNAHLMPFINDIQYYLETGERPPGLLPEVEVNPKAYGGPLGNIYQGKGNRSQKIKKSTDPLTFSNVEDMIKYFEGFRSTPYKDGKSKAGDQWYSIGYGFNDSGLHRNIALQYLNSGKTMTKAEADKLIVGYIDNLDKQLKNVLGSKLYNSLTPGQRMAYIDTGYQNPSVMYRAARIHRNTGDLEKTARALSVANFTQRNNTRYSTFKGNIKQNKGWDGTKSIQENIDNITVKSPYSIDGIINLPQNNTKRENTNITSKVVSPQFTVDADSPIFYHPVQDRAWGPQAPQVVQLNNPNEQTTPLLVQQPKILEISGSETGDQPSFEKLWDSVFPKVEEQTVNVINPYEQFATLRHRPRYTPIQQEVIIPDFSSIANSEYMLFEPIS